MEKINVLIVDDHLLMREGIATMLRDVPTINVIGLAGSGEEAINIAESDKPNIILMDIMMSGMTGLEAAQWIKNSCPRIKIIIVSMEVTKEYIDLGIKAGVEGYLPKNVDKKILVEAIQKVYAGGKFFDQSVTSTLFESYYDNEASGKNVKKANTGLTKRELEVLAEVASGKTNQEVADTLFISIKTVETHKTHILEKLGLRNTAELVKYAIKNNIIEL